MKYPYNILNTVLILVAIAALSPLAHADSARMQMLFERAFNFHQSGDYGRALDLYGQARAVEDDPLISLNMAQVYRRLGQPENALRELERYIETTDPNDPFIIGAQELVPLLEIQAAQARSDKRIAAVERLSMITLGLSGLTIALLIIVLLRRQK